MTFMQAQVSLVKDINPGPSDGVTNQFIGFNNQLYFSANDGINGHELWKSNGSLSGTQLLADLQSNTGISSFPQRFFYSNFANEVYFVANASSTSIINYEPLKIDITGSVTIIKEINTTPSSGDASSYPMYFTEYSNRVYFSAFDSSIGVEVHFTDGTDAGTGVLKNINPEFPVGVNPDNYTVSNGKLFFVALVNPPAQIPATGQELYISDGTEIGTDLLLDINPGTANSSPEYLTDFNNKLYFVADDGTNGRELWVSDGTVAGTQRLNNLNPIVGDLGNPQNFIVFNNALYFTATHASFGTELFKMTTSNTITNLKNIAAGTASSNPSSLFVSNGRLYFSADDGTNGVELWSSTGFSSTTNMIKNINTSPSSPDSNPNGFTEYNGKLYFSANDGTSGTELWVTDGTNAGTILVDDINTSGDSNPENLTVAGDNLFFSVTTPTTGKELFKYYDPTLSINKIELESSIALFPNPVSDGFSIETKHIINHISIIDIQGKSVKTFKEQLTSYNIEELTSGLYFINIKTNEGEITKKLIKQ